jgi:molybdenum cofactor cytidylyltransferase
VNQSIGIIVLAAGASTRMGVSKQMLPYEGETLLRRAVNAALKSPCRPVIVVLGCRAGALRKEIADTEAHVVINPAWAEGMGTSIRFGVAALESPAHEAVEAAVLTLCDQPFVTPDVIARLITAYQADHPRLVVSEYEANGERVRGVPALFHRDLFDELMALQGKEGAKRVITHYESEAVIVPVPEGGFDVDSPDDYRALQNRRTV